MCSQIQMADENGWRIDKNPNEFVRCSISGCALYSAHTI